MERFIRERYQRGSAGSSLGGQLDRLRNGISGGSYNPSATEERHMRYAFMVQIWGSLSPREQAVLFLYHAPIGPAEYTDAYNAVWPDAVDTERDDPVWSCGPKVVLHTLARKPRTYADIAGLLSMSLPMVRKTLHQARTKLCAHPLYGKV